MATSVEDRGRSRRPSVEERRWSHRSGTRWPDDQEVGNAVCGLHRARGDEERRFLSCASKPRSTVCQWFGLKTTGTVFSGLASKPVTTVSLGLASKPVTRVSRFGPQNRQLRFGDSDLKITTTVSWFRPQNQAVYSLLVAPQNRWEGDGMRHASRSNSLLHVEASWARVFQSGLKTGGGATTGSARGTIMKVASSSN
jgi:hypothetical protein